MTTYDEMDSTKGEPFDGIRENRKNSPPPYFNILFYGLIVWGLIFMGYFLFSGWSSQGEFQEKMSVYREQLGQEPGKTP